jgi:HEAT repeat protein
MNEQTRLLVAQAMGELGQPEFAPALIRLLDDRHGIRLAAQQSLSKVAECKEAEVPGLLESEQIEAWRRWAETNPKSEIRNTKQIQNTRIE